MSDANNSIYPEMTVLDIVSRHRKTEAVFKWYDALAGECICCQALFESLRDVARKYNLDLKRLLADLESVILPTCSEEGRIKKLDRGLDELVGKVEQKDDLLVVVTADHFTPS